jgi:hypothetical protein
MPSNASNNGEMETSAMGKYTAIRLLVQSRRIEL